MVAPHPIHSKLSGCIQLAQHIIRGKVRQRGVVIETNPSSNLRMELVKRVRDLPIFEILGDRLEGVRVSICTDNPGTYDVSVEGEYALLFGALSEKLGGGERDRALTVLERMRWVGLNDAV